MKFSIITPTLQRESLKKCCESVNSQTYKDWEHIVMVDADAFNVDLIKPLCRPDRMILKCDHPHRNFGNTCRHNAWAYATGDYVLYLDDDNWLADNEILAGIAVLLSTCTDPWFLFPILRHGQVFYTDPPRLCHADTANIVVSRKIGRWPDGPEYTMDGIWIDGLVRDYPYQAFPNFRPIVVMPTSSEGR